MKKIYSFLLMATMLLVSGNAWTQNVAKIGTTEYATFADAVAAASGLADADNVIELLADVQASDLAVSGKAVIVKHYVNKVEHIKGSEIGGWQLAQAINSQCIVKRGNWNNPVLIGDFEKCIDLMTIATQVDALVGTYAGNDNYYLGTDYTMTKDVTVPCSPHFSSVNFCAGEHPLVFDMAGHTLQHSMSGVSASGNFALVCSSTGTLTIRGNGKIYGQYAALLVCTGTTVVMENGTIATRGAWTTKDGNTMQGGYDVQAFGTFTMLDGTLGDEEQFYVGGKKYCSVIAYIQDGVYDGIVNIKGGTISGTPMDKLAADWEPQMGNASFMEWELDGSVHTKASIISGGVFEATVLAYGATTITGGVINELTIDNYYCDNALISGGKIADVIFFDYPGRPAPIICGGKYAYDDMYYYSYATGEGTYDYLSNFVMEGYEVVPNTDDDKDDYPWKVVLASPTPAVESEMTDGSRKEWQEAWNGELPTATTPTTVRDNHHVYVADGTVATAYDVTINTNTTLTVEKGGTLIVGAGGINGATETNFVVEDGGYVAISPAVAEDRPTGKVEYIAKYAGKKSGVTTVTSSDDLYWEQIAIPTVGKPESFTSVPSYFNTWDITEAWETTNRDGVDTPFKGYFISNENANTLAADHADRVYTFQGELVGNQVNIMKFAREGFTFFGNSYLAPIGIFELLSELNVDNVEATVYIYRPLQETYYSINMATAGRGGRPSQIEPMQGFFVYAADKAHVTPSYMNTVWNVLMSNKASLAPARARRSFSAEATMTLTSLSGKTDELVALESAEFSASFDQNYDARKMMNKSGLNLYVAGETDLAVVASNNLNGTPITLETTSDVQYTFTFSDVAGDLALYDAQTGISTAMVNGATYSFVAQPNSTVSGRFSIIAAPRVPTAIEDIESAPMGIYTITGLYMGEATDWNNLPQGVYIVNGQKLVK